VAACLAVRFLPSRRELGSSRVDKNLLYPFVAEPGEGMCGLVRSNDSSSERYVGTLDLSRSHLFEDVCPVL